MSFFQDRSVQVISVLLFGCVVFKLLSKSPECRGTGCTRYPITRTYNPSQSEFKTTSPSEAMGIKFTAVHTFNLAPLMTLKGMGFFYTLSHGNEYGNDVKYHYLPPDRFEFYQSNYLQKNVECPASFMHHNMRAYILVGQTEEISKKLRAHKFEFSHKGVPFAYVGHPMTYSSSLADGAPANLVPSLFETATSNVGTAITQYDYFLVTGFSESDLRLSTPQDRAPAGNDRAAEVSQP